MVSYLISVACLFLTLAHTTHAGGHRAGVLTKLGGRARKTSEVPEICEYIYGLDFKPSFSACLNEAEVTGQGGVNCSAPEMQNYDSCASNKACSWWHLSGANVCMANPCYRINNGLCTIQNTGGRCVWYTKAQNQAINGVNAPGCYKSPCSNPLKNNKKNCEAKSNDFYECVWCPKYKGQAYGCMNAQAESKAQCWNIDGANALPGCDDCNSGAFTTCTTSSCRQNCCQSPFCTCDLDNERSSTSSAINITLDP